MDRLTLDFYSANAGDVAARYESAPSPMDPYFDIAFPKGGKILDIGFGSGRDMAILFERGFDVYGIDATTEFIALANKYHPDLKGRLVVGALPETGTPFGGEYDGILCCAVLMHLEESKLAASIHSIRALLKKHGRLLISIPSTRADATRDDRDDSGRLFKSYSSHFLKNLFREEGFELLFEWINADKLSRTGITWVTQLYQLLEPV